MRPWKILRHPQGYGLHHVPKLCCGPLRCQRRGKQLCCMRRRQECLLDWYESLLEFHQKKHEEALLRQLSVEYGVL